VRRISASEAARLAAASAELTRRQLVLRMEEAVARRARARRQNIVIMVAAGVVLAMTGTTSLVYSTLTPDVERIRLEGGDAQPDRFATTRTGIVRYGEGGRNRCRQVDFSNEGGGFSNESIVRCADPNTRPNPDDPTQMSTAERFGAIRGGFSKR
jgi:hypothetical protein